MTIRLGFLGVALVAAAPAFATTSISGAVNVDAAATLGAAVDSHTDSLGAVAPTAVSLNTSAKASVKDAGATSSSFTDMSATWASADSGAIRLSWGWNIDTIGYSGMFGVHTNQSYPANWQYTFTASGNGTFGGTYDIASTGYAFGLNALYTNNYWTSGILGGSIFDPAGSGAFSVTLIAGHTYTMSIANYGNLGGGGGLVVDSRADSTIEWHIDYAAAPEPASWAMMLGGFGAIGGALRSRRKAAVSFG